jgi:His-Xaa-Ser repeat protein HxsA
MRHRWLSIVAVAALGALIAGPVLAQGTGSGSSAPSGGSSGSSSPSTPQATSPPSSSGSSGSGTTSSPSTSTMPSSKSQPSAQSGSGTGTKMGATDMKAGSEEVKKVQKALQEKGADPGPIDGILGPKTQSALRTFQKEQKLPETGQMDTQTLAKLGVSKTP